MPSNEHAENLWDELNQRDEINITIDEFTRIYWQVWRNRNG